MKTLRINFRDFWHGNSPEEIRANDLFRFLSRRYELELVEDPDVLIFSSFGTEFLQFKCLRIFYTGENFRPDLKIADYAVSFDYIDDPRHYRLPFYVISPGIAGLAEEKKPDLILASKTRFCNFIYSNPRCKVRNEFFHKLSRYKQVDSAGRFLNNTGIRTTRRLGPPDGNDQAKIPFQQQYKFTIAFENSSRAGYTTEKPVDAMLAHSIPIYWGDPEIIRDLNPRSFINCHDYNSFDDVIEVVKTLDNDDELYKQYLSEPYLTEHGKSCSLNEDRFFDWFDHAVHHPPPVLASARRTARVVSLWYAIKLKHWFLRKFGRLSNIWFLYKRI